LRFLLHYTTHHSRACSAGFGEKCPDPEIDPINNFLTNECAKHQRFDLSFCMECNCFHSKDGWKLCLRNNPPRMGWDERRQMIWKLRWDVCTSDRSSSGMSRERSLFNLQELARITPYEYPFSNAKFVRHRNV
jgi:hypothetical protein